MKFEKQGLFIKDENNNGNLSNYYFSVKVFYDMLNRYTSPLIRKQTFFKLRRIVLLTVTNIKLVKIIVVILNTNFMNNLIRFK